MTKSKFPEDKASEVFELAARLQAEQSPMYSREELTQAGSEVDIPPEFIDAALSQIQAREELICFERLQARERIHWLQRTGLVVGLVAIGGMAFTYNVLVSASQRVDLAWAQVENQFQRRSDLIPNLLAATDRGAKRQLELAATLSSAHRFFLAAQSRPQKIVAAVEMEHALHQFNAVIVDAQSYGGSQLYVGLQDELAGTENRIAVERRRYNQAVASYNANIHMFPFSLVARSFGFKDKPLFAAADPSVPRIQPQ